MPKDLLKFGSRGVSLALSKIGETSKISRMHCRAGKQTICTEFDASSRLQNLDGTGAIIPVQFQRSANRSNPVSPEHGVCWILLLEFRGGLLRCRRISFTSQHKRRQCSHNPSRGNGQSLFLVAACCVV